MPLQKERLRYHYDGSSLSAATFIQEHRPPEQKKFCLSEFLFDNSTRMCKTHVRLPIRVAFTFFIIYVNIKVDRYIDPKFKRSARPNRRLLNVFRRIYLHLFQQDLVLIKNSISLYDVTLKNTSCVILYYNCIYIAARTKF